MAIILQMGNLHSQQSNDCNKLVINHLNIIQIPGKSMKHKNYKIVCLNDISMQLFCFIKGPFIQSVLNIQECKKYYRSIRI